MQLYKGININNIILDMVFANSVDLAKKDAWTDGYKSYFESSSTD